MELRRSDLAYAMVFWLTASVSMAEWLSPWAGAALFFGGMAVLSLIYAYFREDE